MHEVPIVRQAGQRRKGFRRDGPEPLIQPQPEPTGTVGHRFELIPAASEMKNPAQEPGGHLEVGAVLRLALIDAADETHARHRERRPLEQAHLDLPERALRAFHRNGERGERHSIESPHKFVHADGDDAGIGREHAYRRVLEEVVSQSSSLERYDDTTAAHDA